MTTVNLMDALQRCLDADMHRVRDAHTGTTLMIARMSVIAQIFGMHKDAIKRIDFEVAQQGTSNCHFNGRGPRWAPAAITIERVS